MEIGQLYFFLANHLTKNFCTVLEEVPKDTRRRNMVKGKILCKRKTRNYPNRILLLELIIQKNDKHTLGVRGTTPKDSDLKYRINKATTNYIGLLPLQNKQNQWFLFLKKKKPWKIKCSMKIYNNHSNWDHKALLYTSAGYKDIPLQIFIHHFVHYCLKVQSCLSQ